MRFLIALTLCLAVAQSAPTEEDGSYHPESLGPEQDGSYHEVNSKTPASEDDGLYHPEVLSPEEDGFYREVSSERPIGEADGQYHPEPSNAKAKINLIDLNAPHATFIDPLNAVKVKLPLSQPDSAVYTFYSGSASPYEYVPIQVKTEKHQIPISPLVARILPAPVLSVQPRILESPNIPIIPQPVVNPQIVPILQPRVLDSGVPVGQRVLLAAAVVPGSFPLHGDVNVVISK